MGNRTSTDGIDRLNAVLHSLSNAYDSAINLSGDEILIVFAIAITFVIGFILNCETPALKPLQSKIDEILECDQAGNVDLAESREYLENRLEVYKSKKESLQYKLSGLRDRIYQKRSSRIFLDSQSYEGRLKWENEYFRSTMKAIKYSFSLFIITAILISININYFPNSGYALTSISGMAIIWSVMAIALTLLAYVIERKILKAHTLETFISAEYKLYADTIKELQAKASGIRAKLKANDEVISKLKAEIIKRNDAILND